MREISIIETQAHSLLDLFYAANGLEIAEDEPVSTDAIKSWVIMRDGGGLDGVIGACTLAFREGEYIIDGIAVADGLRGSGAGTALLAAAEKEAAARGACNVYLVARAPGFFRANGYETVSREDAPQFFECFGCDQYNTSCFPEVMMHVI